MFAAVTAAGAIALVWIPGTKEFGDFAVPVGDINAYRSIFGGDLAVSIPIHVASEWTVAPTRGRTYLGASVAPADFPAPLRKGAWANRNAGLLVVEIAPDGPAARAGLAVGDLLLDAAGTPLEGIAALRDLLTEQAGRVVRLYLARDGAIVPIDINRGERGA